MIISKEKFKEQFRRMAEEEADIIRPKNREAYIEDWFEYHWQEHIKWHKEHDKEVFRESLTLEQLYRLDH